MKYEKNMNEYWFQGAKVKMDESGNILLKRLGKSPVYVKVSNLETYEYKKI